MSAKKKENTSKKKWWNNILLRTIGIAAVGVLILVLIINAILGGISRHGKEFPMPDFTNLTFEEAKQIAKENNLKLEITDSVYVNNLKKGAITRQNPTPESMVKSGRKVRLTINAVAPKRVQMPLLVGYSLRQAKTELNSSGLRLGTLIYMDDIATNNVLAQQYKGREILAGTEVEIESVIDLVLGLNPNDNSTYIPNLKGYRFSTAKDIILENSLNIQNAIFDSNIKDYSDSLEAVVYRQMPSPSDSVKYILGTNVTIFLTNDPDKLKDNNDL